MYCIQLKFYVLADIGRCGGGDAFTRVTVTEGSLNFLLKQFQTRKAALFFISSGLISSSFKPGPIIP